MVNFEMCCGRPGKWTKYRGQGVINETRLYSLNLLYIIIKNIIFFFFNDILFLFMRDIFAISAGI